MEVGRGTRGDLLRVLQTAVKGDGVGDSLLFSFIAVTGTTHQYNTDEQPQHIQFTICVL